MTRLFDKLYETLLEAHINRRNPDQMDGMSGKYNRKNRNVNRSMVSKRDKKRNTVKGKLRSKMKKLKRGQVLHISPSEKRSLRSGKRTLKNDGRSKSINSKTPNIRLNRNSIRKS